MSDTQTLITFASWEDRFVLGTQDLLQKRESQFNSALMFYFDEWSERSEKNRTDFEGLCKTGDISFNAYKLNVTEPAKTWKILNTVISKHISEASEVTVDISTMPRDIIWTLFWFLERLNVKIQYAYNRPEGYGNWLSRDPQRPRLVYKLSGVSNLGYRTALILLAGYDVDRSKQLIDFFEPEITFLGLQEDDLDGDNAERMTNHVDRISHHTNVKTFTINAFKGDYGQSDIEEKLNQIRESHNVIMSSLGPKLSAISFYRIQKKYPEVALAYAPSKEFNEKYSSGLGESITGSL